VSLPAPDPDSHHAVEVRTVVAVAALAVVKLGIVAFEAVDAEHERRLGTEFEL
jgi:hypothetical protein